MQKYEFKDDYGHKPPEYFYTCRLHHVWYAVLDRGRTKLLRDVADCVDVKTADRLRREYNARLRGKSKTASHLGIPANPPSSRF